MSMITREGQQLVDGGNANVSARVSGRTELQVPAGFTEANGTMGEPYTNTGWAHEIVHDATGMVMVYIPAGSFLMGSPESEASRSVDELQHRVILGKGFYIAKYEVTQGVWEKVMGNNPSHFKSVGEDAPVEQVSWDDCLQLCQELGPGFRLPTEAEWEYACRAGAAEGPASCSRDIAWYADNSAKTTHPVGTRDPNAWGIHDMCGNVWEWCQDWYGEYPDGVATDPSGPRTGVRRITRGGGWNCEARICRSGYRGGGFPDARGYYLGCRLAMTIFDAEKNLRGINECNQGVPDDMPSSTVHALLTSNDSAQCEKAVRCLLAGACPQVGEDLVAGSIVSAPGVKACNVTPGKLPEHLGKSKDQALWWAVLGLSASSLRLTVQELNLHIESAANFDSDAFDLYDAEAFSDLRPLAGLVMLRHLTLPYVRKLRDLSPLASLGALEHLDISGGTLTDLRPLGNLLGLRSLSVGLSSKLRDLSPLRNLHHLEHLSIAFCSELQDLGPLADLRSLKTLEVTHAAVRSLEPLRKLDALEKLSLTGCSQVDSIEPLSELPVLRELSLFFVTVNELSPALARLVESGQLKVIGGPTQ